MLSILFFFRANLTYSFEHFLFVFLIQALIIQLRFRSITIFLIFDDEVKLSIPRFPQLSYHFISVMQKHLCKRNWPKIGLYVLGLLADCAIKGAVLRLRFSFFMPRDYCFLLKYFQGPKSTCARFDFPSFSTVINALFFKRRLRIPHE